MAASAYLARKTIRDIVAEGDAGEHKLARNLGPWSITAMGIGAIIGAGIFVLTGTAAAQYAGPGVMLSFVFAGIACAFVGLCYAELASMIPVSGSCYTYTYATLGEIFAWIIGWDLILEYAMGAATVAVGWSGYVVSLLANFGLVLPPGLTRPPLNLPAAAIVLILTALLVRGTKESARVNNLMVAIKLVVVVAFIAIGAGHVHPENWTPLVPANSGEFGHYGWSGVLRGAAVVFFAFIGFDAVSTAAQESRRPSRDMPIGILGSLVVCTLLYVAVAAVLTGLVPYTQLDVPDPIAKGIDAIGVGWLSVAVKLGALVGLTTVILVLLFGQTRVFLAMSRDGLMPPVFARIHARWHTPVWSQTLIGVIVALVATTLPIHILGEMVSIGTLFAFILVCGAVLHLRRSEPDAPRPFRVTGLPWVPLLGIVCCLALMAGLPLDTWLRLVVWLLIGLAIYFGYGRHHTALARRDPPAPIR
ncbi:MAG: amino acid permease [Burkholderiales bacterium]|nr:amino acid permease [Burkholderiales bacterium]